MAPKRQVYDESKAHFMTFTLINWIKLFNRDEYATIIVDSLNFCVDNKGFEIYSYCIMPSHVHLIARSTLDSHKLSAIMRDLKKFTSVQITRQLEADNSYPEALRVFKYYGQKCSRNEKSKAWIDGFYPTMMYNNKIFKQKLNYIHYNPVEDNLVKYPHEYYYSSAKEYYSGKKGPVKVVVEKL